MINEIDAKIFKEIYKDFFNSITGKYDKDEISSFFMQIGKNYQNTELKCLFVGKATNGWVSDTYDVDDLFNFTNPKRIINRGDEIEWVEKRWGVDDIDEEGTKYNTKRSAFWRVIKGISCRLFSQDDWYKNISWTNIYKFAPGVGNPNGKLQNLQRKSCIQILDNEINYLKPNVIVFLTSNWEWFYLEHLKLDIDKHIEWNGNKTYFVKYNNVLYISSVHPQGKPDKIHIETISKIIKENI